MNSDSLLRKERVMQTELSIYRRVSRWDAGRQGLLSVRQRIEICDGVHPS